MNVKKTRELYNHIIQLEIKIIVEKNTYLKLFIKIYIFILFLFINYLLLFK